MEQDSLRFVITFSRFVTTRFPFWEAFSTAMLIGEWDSTNRDHGIPNLLIYTHIALAVLLGAVMGSDDQRRGKATLYAALQMMFVTIASWIIWSHSPDRSEQVAQRRWFGSDDTSDDSNGSVEMVRMVRMVRLKIFGRNLGIIGAYFLSSQSGSVNRRFVLLGNISISFSHVIQAYLIFAWPHERSKILTMLPLACIEVPVTFLLCVMFCICAYCFVSQANKKPAAKCALAGWSLMFLVNLHFGHWSSYVELWTQLRIIAADICIMSTLVTTYALQQ